MVRPELRLFGLPENNFGISRCCLLRLLRFGQFWSVSSSSSSRKEREGKMILETRKWENHQHTLNHILKMIQWFVSKTIFVDFKTSTFLRWIPYFPCSKMMKAGKRRGVRSGHLETVFGQEEEEEKENEIGLPPLPPTTNTASRSRFEKKVFSMFLHSICRSRPNGGCCSIHDLFPEYAVDTPGLISCVIPDTFPENRFRKRGNQNLSKFENLEFIPPHAAAWIHISSFFSIAGGRKRGWANVWLCKVECYCVFLRLLFSYIRWYVSSLAAIIQDIENQSVKKRSSTFSFLFSTFLIFLLKVNYEIEVYNCACCVCILNSQHFRLPLLFFFVGDHHSFACGGGGAVFSDAAADLISLLSPQRGAKPPSQEIKWASSLLLSLFWEGNGREGVTFA